MKLKRNLFIVMLWNILFSASAFSPYENHLRSGRQTHVMLIAFAKAGNASNANAVLKILNGKKAAKAFRKHKITNLSSYTKALRSQTAYMIYFDYDGENYLDAAREFESVEQAQKMKPFVVPHPRAPQNGTDWLQMEWINYIYGANPTNTEPEKIAQVTRVNPEREAFYRTIHQTVWPGVVDHMMRAGNHDFSIFLVEVGKELYQFYYVESYATEEQKEIMKTYSDPTSQRWYDVAAPCLVPLSGAVNCWLKMEQIH